MSKTMVGFTWLLPAVLATGLFIHKPLYAQDSVKFCKNSLEAGFRSEAFKEPYNNRTYTYIQYGRTIDKVNAFVKVLQYSLGSAKGYQFESDVYWKHQNSFYSNFNGAYSNSTILPNYRLRAEVFKNIRQYEMSLGSGIVKPHNYRSIPLITGTLGYYFGNYFVFLRPTFTLLANGFTSCIQLNGRKYFGDKTFLGLMLLRGSDSGAVRNLSAVENSFGADTYLIRLYGQLKIKRFKIGSGIDCGGIFIPQRDNYANFVGLDITINREF